MVGRVERVSAGLLIAWGVQLCAACRETRPTASSGSRRKRLLPTALARLCLLGGVVHDAFRDARLAPQVLGRHFAQVQRHCSRGRSGQGGVFARCAAGGSSCSRSSTGKALKAGPQKPALTGRRSLTGALQEDVEVRRCQTIVEEAHCGAGQVQLRPARGRWRGRHSCRRPAAGCLLCPPDSREGTTHSNSPLPVFPTHLCRSAMLSSYSSTLMRLSLPTSAALNAMRRRAPSASCATQQQVWGGGQGGKEAHLSLRQGAAAEAPGSSRIGQQ